MFLIVWKWLRLILLSLALWLGAIALMLYLGERLA